MKLAYAIVACIYFGTITSPSAGPRRPRTGEECPGEPIPVSAWQSDRAAFPQALWRYCPPTKLCPTQNDGQPIGYSDVISETGKAQIWVDTQNTVVCFERPRKGITP